jgi:predicted Zn-dependent protease
MHLVKEVNLIKMADRQYAYFMDSVGALNNSDSRAKRITEIGKKVSIAAEKFLQDNGYGHRLDNFSWSFKTVEDPTLNAWCMPGGKVCFYTGLIELSENDDQLAAVMGHEIAHAVAKHGNERMSQQMAVAGIANLASMSQGENSQALSIFDVVFSGTSTLGMLKFSRVHETESDKMGLVFMKLAGYNPYEAISFWEKMAENGANVPQILSTHPSDETRIKDIEEFIVNELDKYVN